MLLTLYIIVNRMLYETVEASKETPKEVRWKVVKAMLDEFPELKQRTKAYLKNKQ